MKKIFLLSVSMSCIFKVYAQGGSPAFKVLNRTSTISESTSQLDSAGNANLKGNFPEVEIYETPTISDWRYAKADMEAIITKREALNSAKKADSEKPIEHRIYKTEDDRKKVNREIAEFDTQIQAKQKEMDDLYHAYVKEYLLYKKVFLFNFGPNRSQAFFDFIYNDQGKRFNTVNTAGFNLGGKTGSIYSELVSGTLGLFRLSFGAMVAKANEENKEEAKKEEAYQRLTTYGGNTVFSLEYPLMYLHSSNTQYNLISRAVIKAAGDLPAFGTETSEFAGNVSGGVDLYADASLDNNKLSKGNLRLFANVNGSWFSGTGEFKKNLGVSHDNFFFGRFTVGLVFLESFKFSVIISTFSSEKELRSGRVIAGGQVIQ